MFKLVKGMLAVDAGSPIVLTTYLAQSFPGGSEHSRFQPA